MSAYAFYAVFNHVCDVVLVALVTMWYSPRGGWDQGCCDIIRMLGRMQRDTFCSF